MKAIPNNVHDLELAGLPEAWQRIATAIGVDNFLMTWEILADPHNGLVDEKSFAYVPRYSTWRRYRRNRLIRALARDGFTTGEIHEQIRLTYGESCSIGHISRIINNKK